ncbi:hypothetical protein PF011_g3891 [Phytophthora fragariae]|uniref:Uncharacterized protein n=1 Tax=Phytophthora fragariae TaxID=53985 RepID=A0A6A3LVA6_9STRA|nr:hypothetical protein PF011_g3891 [Phytophthora fragariae]
MRPFRTRLLGQCADQYEQLLSAGARIFALTTRTFLSLQLFLTATYLSFGLGFQKTGLVGCFSLRRR